MATPTLEALINDLIDQRLRQMQTSYPAEVVSYDSTTSTATVKPLFLETWRGPDNERITEPYDAEEDLYVENVLVMFPRAGNFRMALPIAAGNTGLVVVTKYSLDNFRKGAGLSDPGDMRKFRMSGSLFFPVNLYTDADALDASDDDTVVTISAGGTPEFVALANLVNSELSKIKTQLEGHEHTYTGPGAGTATTTLNTAAYTRADVDATTLKAE
jgi:hypothetical protein